MKRIMTLEDWSGKVVLKAEWIGGSQYGEHSVVVRFIDGTSAEISAYVQESPSRHWDNTAELSIEYEDTK